MAETPRYFTFRELTATGTWLQNVPDWDQVRNLHRLALFLDRIRKEFGGPIRVNSGFRSRAVNRAVGGSATSAHMDGRAADIAPVKGTKGNFQALKAVLLSHLDEIDQCITYFVDGHYRFFHVGLPEEGMEPRMQAMEK